MLEDKKLVELHREKANASFAVGDLYLGKVKKLIPGLNAAFVDIGFDKDAFLHYTDLSPYARSLIKFTQQCIVSRDPNSFDYSGTFQVEPEIIKTGKISEVLGNKPEILVQILKEPIAAKGPRLSCELSLPGRFVVITPFNDIVAVSKKIHSTEERKRLQKIVESVKPKNFGVIVRTAAEGKTTSELHQDIEALEISWKQIQKALRGVKSPLKILSEENKTTSMLRDLLNADFNKIVLNDKNTYDETRNYLQRIAPDRLDIVSMHSNGAPLFDAFNVTRQVKSAFGRSVNLPSGAYLVIEHTEALHVIDVNSGYKSVGNSQEENALQTNIEAAEEIARQMRLRDLGGIIVVDFIDMRFPDNKRKVQETLEAFMANDRARHSVLPMSKFGLMQITRQRMRPEMHINTSENCPTCLGSGKVDSSVMLEDEIEKRISYLVSHAHKTLTLVVNPIVYTHLTKGWFSSIFGKWKRAYSVNLNIEKNSNYHLVDYRFIDEHEEEIKF